MHATLSLFQQGLSRAVRRVWDLLTPGFGCQEMSSASPTGCYRRTGLAGRGSLPLPNGGAAGGRLPFPSALSHLFLPRPNCTYKDPCGAGHVERSGFLVGVEARSWSVSPPLLALSVPRSVFSPTRPFLSPVVPPPVLALPLLPKLLCQAPLWPLAWLSLIGHEAHTQGSGG